MKTFDDIELLWKAPPTLRLPAADDIIRKASKEKNQVASCIFKQAVCLLFSVAAMVFVLCTVTFHHASSYIGIGFMFLCVITFMIIRFRQSRFLRKVDFSASPAVLLQQFENFHKHQKKVNTTGVMWYTIILNIAFAFYLYETLYLAPINNYWKVLTLLVYITWMLIAVFWIGRRSTRKEHARTNAVIEKIRQLQHGLE